MKKTLTETLHKAPTLIIAVMMTIISAGLYLSKDKADLTNQALANEIPVAAATRG